VQRPHRKQGADFRHGTNATSGHVRFGAAIGDEQTHLPHCKTGAFHPLPDISRLFRLDAGCLDDLWPTLQLALDEGVELLRRAANDVGALTRGNVAHIFSTWTSPTETGLAGWGDAIVFIRRPMGGDRDHINQKRDTKKGPRRQGAGMAPPLPNSAHLVSVCVESPVQLADSQGPHLSTPRGALQEGVNFGRR
jgi:hypothetical protein